MPDEHRALVLEELSEAYLFWQRRLDTHYIDESGSKSAFISELVVSSSDREDEVLTASSPGAKVNEEELESMERAMQVNDRRLRALLPGGTEFAIQGIRRNVGEEIEEWQASQIAALHR